MAINDAIARAASQQNVADSEYKSAWNSAPSAGLGQFGASVPGAASAVPGGAKPLQTAVEQAGQTAGLTMGNNKPLAMSPGAAGAMGQAAAGATPLTGGAAGSTAFDALPTTSAGATSSGPVKEAIETTSNFSGAAPYVSDVTALGDVGRQAERPERLPISDAMSADEQYRRAWQNEANGYFGNEAEVTAKPEVVDNIKAPVEVKPAAPIEYGVSYQGQTDSSDGEATVYDKATGKVVKQFPGMDLHQRMGGVGAINSDQLKQFTGWSAPVDNTGAGA